MEKRKVYVDIEPIGKLDKLQIKVDYNKGGFNCFSGGQESRGVYVYLIPTQITRGCVSQMITGRTLESGFKMCVKEVGRRSPKIEERVWNAIQGRADQIAKLFRASQFQECYNLIKNLTQDI